MMEPVRTITTDTATICIFDLAAMAHRKGDVGDWWSIPRDRVVEIKNRNALFIDVGDDGTYDVVLSSEDDDGSQGFCLATPSGRVFIGPGEEMSGADFEPDGKWGGFFISVEGPYQKVTARRDGDAISIDVRQTDLFENEPVDMITLRETTPGLNDR
jgi:hypothetical protein